MRGRGQEVRAQGARRMLALRFALVNHLHGDEPMGSGHQKMQALVASDVAQVKGAIKCLPRISTAADDIPKTVTSFPDREPRPRRRYDLFAARREHDEQRMGGG